MPGPGALQYARKSSAGGGVNGGGTASEASAITGRCSWPGTVSTVLQRPTPAFLGLSRAGGLPTDPGAVLNVWCMTGIACWPGNGGLVAQCLEMHGPTRCPACPTTEGRLRVSAANSAS